ncbi:MAG: hypothetical protein FWF25_07830 [Propionibacteriaceae bacterium]|nr:hypothetical protein [Propionibacteriaceae bacterium]
MSVRVLLALISLVGFGAVTVGVVAAVLAWSTWVVTVCAIVSGACALPLLLLVVLGLGGLLEVAQWVTEGDHDA